MTSQADRNKELALSWYRALFAGDRETCESLLDPDCRFFIAGDMAFCGWSDKQTFMQSNPLPLRGAFQMDFGHVVAEGDFVFLEAESHADLEGGQRYNNNYGFLLRFKDGKMIEHKEYTDTLHFYRVVDSEAVRGPAIPRQSPLTVVSASVGGQTIQPQQSQQG